eukprot:9170808-Prorocentrum_lima.AAC.1
MVPMIVKLQIQIGVQPSAGCPLVFEIQLVLEFQHLVLVLVELYTPVLQQAVVVVVPQMNLPASDFNVSSE